MGYIKRIFRFYSIKYFLESYAVAIFLCFLYFNGRNGRGVLVSVENLPELLFLIFSTLLYPFGKATYLYLKDSLTPEGTVYFGYVVVIFIGKLIMSMILYGLAIPLGIINILIIALKYRKAKEVNDSIDWYE